MNLPIINAAAEGTISVAVVFAATAYYGINEFIIRMQYVVIKITMVL